MAGLDPGAFALVFVAVLLGSTVQAVVGLGIGLIAAPVITLVAPELMPGVLIAVAVTWRAVAVPINRGTLSAAGFIGGVTGTATSIGGPPFALLYQHRPPPQIRSTMAVYFLVGAAISLVGLGLSGDLEAHQLAVATVLLPAVGLGVLVGAPLRRLLPAHRVRPTVLAVSAASALVLVARSLL
jgi:uncharacterized membrane protein YfcA